MNARYFFCLITVILTCYTSLCLGDNVLYKLAPNKSEFPYPTMLPDVANDDRANFDWKRYLEEAASPADKAYRALEAPPEYGMQIDGGNRSNYGDYIRAKMTAEELVVKCTKLENAFRERLRAKEPSELKLLEEFIENRKLAMNAEVQLIGGSWGGSGAKTAYAAARMSATLDYLHALKGLHGSLYFQDMAE